MANEGAFGFTDDVELFKAMSLEESATIEVEANDVRWKDHDKVLIEPCVELIKARISHVQITIPCMQNIIIYINFSICSEVMVHVCIRYSYPEMIANVHYNGYKYHLYSCSNRQLPQPSSQKHDLREY